MVKVILQTYPVIPAAGEEERAALKPLGRNRERYQRTLEEWHDVIRAADELGFWGVATIEHHLWSEGYEVGPAPGIIDAYWAAITKNVRVGQLGYVMSTQHPLRVAEETAILDHLTKGRTFVGFARGYQSRWTNIFGQHLGTRATRSPSALQLNPDFSTGGPGGGGKAQLQSDDETNRRIFEEEIEIVLKAWTQDSFDHNGRVWQIPYPYDKGVDDWQLAHAGVTGRMGGPGEVGPDGSVRRISVVPAPYTVPHPPVFVASSSSPESIAYCGRMGFIPTYFAPTSAVTNLSEVYRDAAAAAGHNFVLGQNENVVRWPQIADSMAAARQQVLDYDSDIYKNFYAAMGRRRLDQSNIVQSIIDSGLYAIGTVDDVRRQLVEQWQQVPAEYITLIMHFAQMPKEVAIRTMDVFMKEIKPALDELTPYSA